MSQKNTINTKLQQIETLEDIYKKVEYAYSIEELYKCCHILDEKIESDFLIQNRYSEILNSSDKTKLQIAKLARKLKKITLYLDKGIRDSSSFEIQELKDQDCSNYLYFPSLDCFLRNDNFVYRIFLACYQGISEKTSIIGIYESIFSALFKKLTDFDFEELNGYSYRELKNSRRYDYIVLKWVNSFWNILKSLEKDDDNKINIYLFNNKAEKIVKNAYGLIEGNKNYSLYYLKAILLKTIDTILLELQSIKNLTKKQQAIIDYIKENPNDKLEKTAEGLNKSVNTIADQLSDICKNLKIFYIEKDGRKSYGFKAVKKYVKNMN